MLALEVVTPPSVEPLTVAEAKSHLRVDGTAEDVYIGALVTAARSHVETVTNRALIDRQLRLSLDYFTCEIRLPRAPLQSVDSIDYIDLAGASQTLPPAEYQVDSVTEPARLRPAPDLSWPETDFRLNAVKILFTAGYGTTEADVPEDIRHALRLLIGHYYAHPESVVAGAPVAELPQAVDALLAPHHVWMP